MLKTGATSAKDAKNAYNIFFPEALQKRHTRRPKTEELERNCHLLFWQGHNCLSFKWHLVTPGLQTI